MSFAAYLSFDGTCREAMTWYADIFGATDLQIMSGADVPPGTAFSFPADRVMHSQFTAGPGAPLMASDAPPGMARPQQGVSVFHAAPDGDAARRIFDRLSQGGTVMMPLGPVFWTEAFGMLTDRFGTSWQITIAPKEM